MYKFKRADKNNCFFGHAVEFVVIYHHSIHIALINEQVYPHEKNSNACAHNLEFCFKIGNKVQTIGERKPKTTHCQKRPTYIFVYISTMEIF